MAQSSGRSPVDDNASCSYSTVESWECKTVEDERKQPSKICDVKREVIRRCLGRAPEVIESTTERVKQEAAPAYRWGTTTGRNADLPSQPLPFRSDGDPDSWNRIWSLLGEEGSEIREVWQGMDGFFQEAQRFFHEAEDRYGQFPREQGESRQGPSFGRGFEGGWSAFPKGGTPHGKDSGKGPNVGEEFSKYFREI